MTRPRRDEHGKATALKRLLDIAFVTIFLLSIAALFVANEDPFVRKLVCAHTGICSVIPHSKALYKIIYDLAVGSLITLFFYLLVVRLPECERRQRLKASLERHYRAFREDCITIMLMVLDDPAGLPESETLTEPEAFRHYFNEKVTHDQTRWHDFQNKLGDQYQYMRKLLSYMEIFREELVFILNNTDMPKDDPFEFLKQMSATIYLMRDVTPGYDESKPLAALSLECVRRVGFDHGFP